MEDLADNENQYEGFDNDTFRTTCGTPRQDRMGPRRWLIFGSAHPNAANFVLCEARRSPSAITSIRSLPPPRHPQKACLWTCRNYDNCGRMGRRLDRPFIAEAVCSFLSRDTNCAGKLLQICAA